AALTEVFTAEVYLDALVGEASTLGSATAESGRPLGAAIKDYGHYAQAMLDEAHTTWEVGTDCTAIAPSAGDLTTIAATDMKGVNAGSCTIPDDSGIDTAANNGVQFSLNLDSATTINIYLKTKSACTLGVTVDDVDYTPEAENAPTTEDTYNVGAIEATASTTYKVQIADIPAHELAKEHTITVTTKASDTDAVSFPITLSPLSYARSVLASSADTTSDAEKKAATALYNYYKATMEYRATKGYNEAVDTAFAKANTEQQP
ncbi:MAG: hypothetical protein II877_02675, partial [Synergistaceae bacterium]|nr:hypothetical protein [Synergistaceae bacterium]